MKRINAYEFSEKAQKNPSWCLEITEPLEITGVIHMRGHSITHLSPLLHFKAEERGWSANFSECKYLKHACGTFYGYAHFVDSAVEKTTGLTIIGREKDGWSANFEKCPLKILEGEFEYAVNVSETPIEKIQAKIKNASMRYHDHYKDNVKIFAMGCKKLKPREKYLNGEYQIDYEFERECEEWAKKERLRKGMSRFPSL